MNQKKTSKKTSLFAPTYSSTSVSKDNLRIAKPATIPAAPTIETTTTKVDTKQSDFELSKYYENLNNQFDLNLNDSKLANSQLNQTNNRFNQNDGLTNQLNNRMMNQEMNQQNNQIMNQEMNQNVNSELDQQLNQQENKTNYSSYFGINRLTNYFSLSTNNNKPEIAANNNEMNSSVTQTEYKKISFQNSSFANDDNYENVSNSQVNSTIDNRSSSILATSQSVGNLLNFHESNSYHLPKPHWFYKVPSSNKRKDSSNNDKAIYEDQDQFSQTDNDSSTDENWLPFAFHDSETLERAYQSLDSNPNVVVPTNGDRYDCYIKDRFRRSVYWKEKDQEIRRCTWYFKKEGHTKFIPYTEQFAFKLEQIYYDVLMNQRWNQRIELNSNNQEMIIFYSYNSIIHYELNDIKDEWNTVNENPVKPRMVNRELTVEELENYDVCLKEDELYKVDHLIFLAHGIGGYCDIRLRPIKEVVDDLRKISLELTRTHFRENNGSTSKQEIGRCEFIPVYWHDFLHGNETQIDERLKAITLKTVPKLRSFTNDSVLDALFYTSPVYCQHIINTVTNEINRLYDLFILRNPYFKGTVSLSGHSLGSVILFDLLANQCDPEEVANLNSNNYTISTNSEPSETKKLTDNIIYNKNTVKHGQENIKYPKLKFKTDCFFALGSPISMFLTLRGITQIDEKFHLPNCLNVFNIFHPLDPIAYRLEPMIKKEFINLEPVIIAHHRGRKRMHLEIKENLAKISSDIKNTIVFGIKSTWDSVNSFVGMPRSNSNLSEMNEKMNNNVQQNDLNELNSNLINEDSDLYEYSSNGQSANENHLSNRIGSLNKGSRIDYVLQEKPIEFFNQYIFALATHACYWTSEDCILFIISKLFSLNKKSSNLEDNQHSNNQHSNNQHSNNETKNQMINEMHSNNQSNSNQTVQKNEFINNHNLTSASSPSLATLSSSTGLSSTTGLAYKRPSSQQSLPDHISTSIDIE